MYFTDLHSDYKKKLIQGFLREKKHILIFSSMFLLFHLDKLLMGSKQPLC